MTHSDFRFWEKKIEFGTESVSFAQTTTIEIPECQERRGEKQ